MVLISIMEYVIVFLVIAMNYTMIERDMVYNVSENTMAILLIISCFAVMILRLIEKPRIIKRTDIWKIIAIFIISLLSVIIPGINVRSGMIRWVIPILASSCFFLFNSNTKEFWIKFTNVVVCMAVVSLILYFGGTVAGIIQPTRIAVYRYDDVMKTCKTYFGLQYEAQRLLGINISTVIYRNCGIFIEAPMYNIVLCIALAAELAFQKKVRRFVVVILIVTIITTYATTGLIFLALMAFVKIVITDGNNRMRILKLFGMPIATLCILYCVSLFLVSKTQSISGEASVSIRTDHLVAALRMWLSRPLFGSGYLNDNLFYQFTNYDQGYSVGLPVFLGMHGIFMFAVYFGYWLKNVIVSLKTNKKELYFWLGTFLCLFLTAVTFKILMVMIISSQILWRAQRESEDAAKATVHIKFKIPKIKLVPKRKYLSCFGRANLRG